MLSAKAVFEEIFASGEAFQLFCSIAASGEAQGGWENGRIAALVPESCRDLAPKIARHGADEDKHGRIFRALLRKRGLEPVPVPAETDYTMLLENAGFGLAHGQLRRDEKLTERDIVMYLAHSRVIEQRASEQMRSLHPACTARDGPRRDWHLPGRQQGCHGAPGAHLALAQAEVSDTGGGHPGRVRLRKARRLAADGIPEGTGPAQRTGRPSPAEPG